MGREVLHDLRARLRGDPRMAREGHAAVLQNDDTLEHSYAGHSVFTCWVGDNVFVLEYLCIKDFENKKTEFKLSEVAELKDCMVQLIARAIDRPAPQAEPASHELINGIYKD